MEYSIRELSQMAGVSARTLRYYDEIGLLKPLYVTEAGYRYYGEKEVDILQQILFYRERKFDLKSIKKMLCEDDFDRMRALEEHLAELEKQRDRLESLIGTVKQTISAMKGEWVMSDPEKFQAFKEKMVRENEEQYGREVREKYGDEEVDASNRNMLNMTENEWEHFQKLEREIRESLQDCVRKGVRADSEPVTVLFNRNTAPFTNGFCPRHQYLCFQLWLCGQYRIAEVFAKQRVGNGLNAYAGFSVIKEQTVSSVIICTQALYQGISFVSLSPRHLREHCYHRFLLLSLQLRQACCSDRNTHRWIA